MSDENNTFENNNQQVNQNLGTGYQDGMNYQSQNSNNGSGKGQGTGLGVASMVCGICSILIICAVFTGAVILAYLAPVLGIVAIVLGIVQIVKNESKGMAVAGIVCGAIGILIFVGIICIGLYAISSGLYDEIMNQYGVYY